MSNYVKQTWADNDSNFPLSAARMAVIENGIYDAHFQPAVRVFRSANQSIATATLTALAFDQTRYDTDNVHDTVTNNSRFTCKTAGKYAITGNVSFAANATGFRRALIRLNGTTNIAAANQLSVTASLEAYLNVRCDYDLAVNDYVELVVEQTSGGALNVLVAGNFSPEFAMVRVA